MERDIIALQIFRNRYGIAVNPEAHPILWDVCLNLADEHLHGMPEEGGEA